MKKQNLKNFLLIAAISVTFFACNKDKITDESPSNLECLNEKILLSHSETDVYTLSLFGNNKIVPAHVARSVAERINMTLSQDMVGAGSASSYTTIRKVDSLFTISDSTRSPIMYIANYNDGGFAVISADERHQPICAFVEQGKYESAEVPSMLLDWLDITFENIQLVRLYDNDYAYFSSKNWIRVIKDIDKEEYLVIDAIEDCCPECPNYPECLSHPHIGCGDPNVNCGGGGSDPCAPYTTIIKGPLMTTNWGQGCTYNEQCPDLNCSGVCYSNGKAWAGCVATAMAQILRYWSHNCTQGYNYATMPNNSGNGEVQRMMKDIGDTVDMDYGCDASGADGDMTANAFKNTFCYSSATRSVYGSGSYQVVVQNLNANRPVLLDGCRTRKRAFPWLWYTYSNCHMWVCDGYEHHQNSCYSILRFHMNWGWNGTYNGWYFFDTWNPGTYNYQYAKDFTYNIYP